ncbi:MAG: radical SAM family heme chaperone HemW [Bacteroidetes bacterium]|nr:radical SAM family heme chaperone HemW [Bacteroidota bacterium]
MSGIYIHIPFCRKACLYCDFHFSTHLLRKKELVDTLCIELQQRKNYLEEKNIETIYFGGGTPSTLDMIEVAQILNTIYTHFSVTKNPEITFEINPEDAHFDYLQELKTAGVNRLSVGLQSFNDAELKWFNRAHTAQQSVACIKKAQQVGFQNISIDLIYGSKFQTPENWMHTLQTAFSLSVQHLSSYNLTVETKTQLQHRIAQKKEQTISNELSAQLFDILMMEAEKNGFFQYEISNFCTPNFMSLHNSRYWQGFWYLGVGPSAHSFNGVSRRYNVKSNAQYMQAFKENKKYFEEEILTTENKYNEYILTRLRTHKGCNIEEIRCLFGEKYARYFLNEIQKQGAFIQTQESHFCLTKQGKHFADGIASDLFYLS